MLGPQSLVHQIRNLPTARIYILGWLSLAALAVANGILAQFQGLVFSPPMQSIMVVGGLLLCGAIFALLFGVGSRVAPMLFVLALWLGTRPIGMEFTYLLASFKLPLIDDALDQFDKALGFNWLHWFHFVNANEALRFALAAAYTSMSLQIIFSILYFAHREENHKSMELWWCCFVALVVTTILSGLLPAVGTFEYYGVANETRGVHLPDLYALRDGSVTSFSVEAMKGIITLPSYHTAAAALLTYIYRQHSTMLSIVLPLNVLQFISIPSQGGHYIADMVAGVLVAIVAVWIVRALGLDTKPVDSVRRSANKGAAA